MILAGEIANSADFLNGLTGKLALPLRNSVAGTKALRLPVALGCVFGKRLPSSSQFRCRFSLLIHPPSLGTQQVGDIGPAAHV